MEANIWSAIGIQSYSRIVLITYLQHYVARMWHDAVCLPPCPNQGPTLYLMRTSHKSCCNYVVIMGAKQLAHCVTIWTPQGGVMRAANGQI